MNDPPRVLFLCTGNCIRSQMAEGILRHLAKKRFVSLSAGVHPAGFVHELAIEVLGEIGVDLTDQTSKPVEVFLPPRGREPEFLISLCEYAASVCPDFPPHVRLLHWPVDDPITATGPIERRLRFFRRVRDEIRARIEQALADGELDSAGPATGGAAPA